MKLTTHEELVKHHGEKVTCEIEGKEITDAVINVEEDRKVYICQNIKDGSSCFNKHGYEYSWLISYPDVKYETAARYCENITIVPALVSGCKVWVSDISEKKARANKKEHIFLANIGGRSPYICVNYGDEYLYPDGSYLTASWRYAIPVETDNPLQKELEEQEKKLAEIQQNIASIRSKL